MRLQGLKDFQRLGSKIRRYTTPAILDHHGQIGLPDIRIGPLIPDVSV